MYCSQIGEDKSITFLPILPPPPPHSSIIFNLLLSRQLQFVIILFASSNLFAIYSCWIIAFLLLSDYEVTAKLHYRHTCATGPLHYKTHVLKQLGRKWIYRADLLKYIYHKCTLLCNIQSICIAHWNSVDSQMWAKGTFTTICRHIMSQYLKIKDDWATQFFFIWGIQFSRLWF